MIFQELVEFFGPLKILIECCLRPFGALFLFLGVICVKQSNAEGKSDKSSLWLGAILIAIGVLLLAGL
jgi:hypothetical protein